MAKIVIVTGMILVGCGLLLMLMGKIPGFGKLPGDIYKEIDHNRFYFPLTSTIIFSIILSILLFLILTLMNRR